LHAQNITGRGRVHPPSTPSAPRLTLGHVADELLDLAVALGTAAHAREDGTLAGLAVRALHTATSVHAIGEALATVAGVPDTREGSSA
jgi:hypothetical protein